MQNCHERSVLTIYPVETETMKQLIGEFEVVNSSRRSSTVSVYQETIMNGKNIVVGHSKTFAINGTGEEVTQSDDPNLYLREDGSWLKKISSVQSADRIRTYA